MWRGESYTMKVKKHHTSLHLDPELWKKVKIEAIKRDMEAQQLVDLALRKELNIK